MILCKSRKTLSRTVFFFLSIQNPGNVDMAKILIKNGANINVKTHLGITPIHTAADTGNSSNYYFRKQAIVRNIMIQSLNSIIHYI